MTKSIIATWPFSEPGVSQAVKILQSSTKTTALDAIEGGIEAIELDPTVTSVGYGGLPNAQGKLELDAGLMSINPTQYGSVMSVHGLKSTISLARLISSSTCKHTMLAGNGALEFAQLNNMKTYKSEELLTDHAKKRYKEYLSAGPDDINSNTIKKPTDKISHTDTVGMIVHNGNDSFATGCATSGMQFKLPGRVGDSPIFGSGLYLDHCGGATATGDGDQMLKYCLSYHIVERLKLGDSVSQASNSAIQRIIDNHDPCQAAVIAMDKNGNVAAASTHGGFVAITWDEVNGIKRIETNGILSHKWEHSCV